MIKHALQRLLGRAPNIARWASRVMPEPVRREVEPAGSVEAPRCRSRSGHRAARIS
jgi:hypothetical protein